MNTLEKLSQVIEDSFVPNVEIPVPNDAPETSLVIENFFNLEVNSTNQIFHVEVEGEIFQIEVRKI